MISPHQNPSHDNPSTAFSLHSRLVAELPLPLDLAVTFDGEPQPLNSITRTHFSVLMHPSSGGLNGCLVIEEVFHVTSDRHNIDGGHRGRK